LFAALALLSFYSSEALSLIKKCPENKQSIDMKKLEFLSGQRFNKLDLRTGKQREKGEFCRSVKVFKTDTLGRSNE